MFFRIILKYILGYINIKIEGYSVEKLINICIKNGMLLWNIKRSKSTIVYANVGVKEFREIVRIAKKNGCKIKIINKKGLPFLLHRYKKRKIFFILIIAILFALVALSQFIWNIKIEGNEKIESSQITQILENKGIKLGTAKRNIDKQKIINEIRLERSDIAWIGIDIEGTNLIVKIVETNAKPEIVNEEDYCNVVATKDAQIVKISAQNGIPLVKEESVVTKGDILIAGWIEGKYTGTRYVHANGEVMAKVWYTKKEEVLLNQVIEQETGIKENRYKLKINKFEINLFKRLPKFEKYDTIETEKKLKIFSNFYLPIELIQITYKEKLESQITYGIEEAKDIGRKKAEEELQNEINNTNVLQKYENAYVNSNSVTIELTYEVLENIGTKEKIVFWKDEKVWKKKVLKCTQKIESFLQN